MQTKLINFPYKQDILAISIHVNNIGIYVRANCLNGVMFYVWYAIVQTSKIWFHRQMAKATMEKWIFPLIWHGFIFSVIELAQVSSHTSTFLFLCLNTFCDWRNTKTPLWNNLVPRFGFLIPVRLFYRAVVLYFTLLYIVRNYEVSCCNFCTIQFVFYDRRRYPRPCPGVTQNRKSSWFLKST